MQYQNAIRMFLSASREKFRGCTQKFRFGNPSKNQNPDKLTNCACHSNFSKTESEETMLRQPTFYSQMVVDWKRDGFSSEEIGASWAPRGCGITCLRMLLEFSLQARGLTLQDSYWDLIKRGVDEGAYGSNGWIHNGLLKLARPYGLDGECHRRKDARSVFEAVRRGSLCIVSVSLAFRGGECINGKTIEKGGHLILVYGIDTRDDGTEQLICHHPSSYPDLNFRDCRIDNEKFVKSFSGNFIEFYAPLKTQSHGRQGQI
jgi:hypothetical protein